jgi:hypothetical protein
LHLHPIVRRLVYRQDARYGFAGVLKKTPVSRGIPLTGGIRYIERYNLFFSKDTGFSFENRPNVIG